MANTTCLQQCLHSAQSRAMSLTVTILFLELYLGCMLFEMTETPKSLTFRKLRFSICAEKLNRKQECFNLNHIKMVQTCLK